MVLSFEVVDEIVKGNGAKKSYCVVFLVTVFVLMLYKVVSTFESVGKILTL